ncbi:hypothetical protein ACMGGS_12130 [Superficieibacter sp. BNK-5]|uniref:hypothetical protein n=1 Tax=Superficieibacter sp. BNK-5 TaxID=3376142 RepID=UPI0039BFFBC8
MDRKGSLELLEEVQDTLTSLHGEGVMKPVKIKAILEHLRSALEYVANDTYDKLNPGIRSNETRIYFPYGKKSHIENFFKKKLRVASPETFPLYEVFSSIQDFRTGDTWLEMMCNLTNEVKHRNPIPLDEQDVVTGRKIVAEGINIAEITGNGSITIGNLEINDKKSKGFTFKDNNLDASQASIAINLVITKEKKIRFHGSEYEVIPFIEKCLAHIKKFVNDAYDILEKDI